MTAIGGPSRLISRVEVQGPDPGGWIETLFYHLLRTLVVENAVNLAVALPAVLVVGGFWWAH